MRMLVIGSSDTSDTSGASLQGPSQAWPRLVATELATAIGEPVDFTDVTVVPVGPKAVPRVENALHRTEPDLVVFGFGAFHFIIGTVGQRVHRRYGEPRLPAVSEPGTPLRKQNREPHRWPGASESGGPATRPCGYWGRTPFDGRRGHQYRVGDHAAAFPTGAHDRRHPVRTKRGAGRRSRKQERQ
jgi:hypothetical protein